VNAADENTNNIIKRIYNLANGDNFVGKLN